MKFLIGKKLYMTQRYESDGTVVPVTLVHVGNGVVTQVKHKKVDGYDAVQIGAEYGSKRVSKALKGHLNGRLAKPYIAEFRVEHPEQFSVGNVYDITNFTEGEIVTVTGTSKGRGYAGVVKRHGFHGSPKTHGHKHDHRAPGSIGATDPQRVFPGMRMSGRMGGVRVSVPNVLVSKVDEKEQILYIRGAVPGARNSVVFIKAEGEMSPRKETPSSPEHAEPSSVAQKSE